MPDKLTKNDLTLLQRLAKSPAVYTYAPDPKGGSHVRLVRSTCSVSLRKKFEAFALTGLVAMKCDGDHDPPMMTVTFSLTALGRDAIGEQSIIKPYVNVQRAPSDSELLRQANDGA